MQTTIEQASLYLCPVQADFAPTEITSLTAILAEIGFIARPIITTGNKHSFYTGPHYLDYINYLGCSPAIQFSGVATSDETITGSSFCHIKIHRYRQATLLSNRQPPISPLCPGCKKPLKNWQQNPADRTIKCPHCRQTAPVESYNWRKLAGYARLFIEITDIFPREAMPQPVLLQQLAAVYGIAWSHFYAVASPSG